MPLGALAGGIGLLVVEELAGHYDRASIDLVVAYGDYSRYLLDLWYLPARFQSTLRELPAAVQPVVNVATWVTFWIVGLALGALLFVRMYMWRRKGVALSTAETFLGLCGIGALIVALLVRHRLALDNIGTQTLTLFHLVALVLSIVPAARLVSYIAMRLHSATMQGVVGIAALLALTAVSHRAAEAALHDQEHRAHVVSDAELSAYQWIETHTDEQAIVAAHPDYQVNESGEAVLQTNVLPALTARRAYLARVSGANRALGDVRIAQLWALFSAESNQEVCGILRDMPIDYLIEHRERPLSTPGAPCLEPVLSGDPTVYRVEASSEL